MKARTRAKRVVPAARDTDHTPFTEILQRLLSRLPGAFAAGLVDNLGETVDYAGSADPFDVKVAAAHGRILFDQVERFGALGHPRWLVIRAAKRTIVVRGLPEDYAVVVLLRRRAGFTASRRAFAACERELCREAGWKLEDQKPAWYPVDVEFDKRGRPTRVAGALAVEVLGAVVGLPIRERGFRVRTSAGSEVTLVREARNCWYADDDVLPRSRRPGERETAA